jgi:hypothetical protein
MAQKHAATIEWLAEKDNAQGRLRQQRLYAFGQNPSFSDILGKVHKYYFSEAGMMYDDESTHIRLMREWGFKLVYSGATTFRALMKQKALLKTGKKYIFDIEGHTVLVTLKQALPEPNAVTDQENLGDYFRLYNNPQNWDKSDAQTMELPVEDIYEK